MTQEEKSLVCDHYCKFPNMARSQEELDQICDKCMLDQDGLHVGDIIECKDKEDAVDTLEALCKNDYDADFLYNYAGRQGIWLEITSTPEQSIEARLKKIEDYINNKSYEALTKAAAERM